MYYTLNIRTHKEAVGILNKYYLALDHAGYEMYVCSFFVGSNIHTYSAIIVLTVSSLRKFSGIDSDIIMTDHVTKHKTWNCTFLGT